MIAERDVMDVYRTIYMQRHIGDEFEGRISGFAPFGIFVQVLDPFVSVLLPFEQLEDTYEPDDLGIRLIGIRTSKIFTMNDPVTVRIEDANVQARNVVGSLQAHEQAEAPTQPQRRRAGGSKRAGDARERPGAAKRQGSGKKQGSGKRQGSGKTQGSGETQGSGKTQSAANKQGAAKKKRRSSSEERSAEPRKRPRRARRK